MYMTSYLNDGAPIAPDTSGTPQAPPSTAGIPVVSVEPSSAPAPATQSAAVPAAAVQPSYVAPTWLQSNWKMVAGVGLAVAAVYYLKRR